MSVFDFESLKKHSGHRLECNEYGTNDLTVNVTIECIDCNEILIDYDKYDDLD